MILTLRNAGIHRKVISLYDIKLVTSFFPETFQDSLSEVLEGGSFLILNFYYKI